MNRAPSTIWSLRKDPNRGFVRTTDNDRIQLALPCDHEGEESCGLIGVELTRADARLLAKRINACLDKTRKS